MTEPSTRQAVYALAGIYLHEDKQEPEPAAAPADEAGPSGDEGLKPPD